MFGLFAYNLFNQNNFSVGKELWAMTLANGQGNPDLKVNPIYVKEIEKTSEEDIEQ